MYLLLPCHTDLAIRVARQYAFIEHVWLRGFRSDPYKKGMITGACHQGLVPATGSALARDLSTTAGQPDAIAGSGTGRRPLVVPAACLVPVRQV